MAKTAWNTTYPNEGIVNGLLGSWRHCGFGRNGSFYCTGVTLQRRQQMLRIRALTSRNQPSTGCYIDVPLDRDTILAIAASFVAISMTLEAPDTTPAGT